jgi:3-oxoadipate enol-lactonase
MGKTMAFASVDGLTLHYRLAGRVDGPTLVFANAVGCDFRIWDDVIDRLAASYRVLAYDKRGHGLSDARPAPYRLDDHVGDLVGLLDDLGIDRFGLVGLSVGGMIAQRLAAVRPDRIEALALCATAAKIGTRELWDTRISAVKRAGIEAIAGALLERWFSPSFRAERADDAAGWRNMLVRTPVDGYAGTCAAIRDADLTTEIGAIRVPTLCVAGTADLSTPPDLVRATAASIPGAHFRMIDGAGHMPSIEQPGVLALLLQTFFREVGFV